MNRVCADGIVCAAATLSVADEDEEEEGRIIEGRIVCACDDGRGGGGGGGCLGTSWYISDAARKKVGLPVKLPVSIERVWKAMRTRMISSG